MSNLTLAEQMLYSTVKLVAMKAGKPCGTGTGFFMNFVAGKQVTVPAIVTNKHVVNGANAVVALCHIADASDDKRPSGKFASCTISTNNVLRHPDKDIDLCAIPMAHILNQAAAANSHLFIVTLGMDLIPADDEWDHFDAIEAVTMIGCPNGLSDEVNNLPIVRSGITATALGKHYNGKPEFMVDMACFPGSSGSPVFLYDRAGYLDRKANTYRVGGHRLKLVGVLYAGPHFTAEGQIVLAKPPQFMVNTMMHLGIVIRSSELRVLDGEIRKLFPSTETSAA